MILGMSISTFTVVHVVVAAIRFHNEQLRVA